ncbi:retrovirus-related Pol polyprotein from transposon opus [Trichonephila clavipes]|nr:retrovirus-related Pol polyprotein from transposon opus [Trichonephila clavipes]
MNKFYEPSVLADKLMATKVFGRVSRKRVNLKCPQKINAVETNERFQEQSSAILTAKVAIPVYSPAKENEKIDELQFVHIKCGNEILKAVIDTVPDIRGHPESMGAVERWNRHVEGHVKEKQFKVGDKVLVLLPSSTHKLMKTWIGPATIIEITRPYSVKVELDDGGIRELHFNKLRPYIARVGQVGFDLRSRLRFRGPSSLCSNRYGCIIYGGCYGSYSDCQELDDVQRLNY